MPETSSTPPGARPARARGRRLSFLPAGRRGQALLAGLAVLLLIATVALVSLLGRGEPPAETVADDPAPVPSATPTPTEPEPTPTPAPAEVGAPPERLRVPSIGLDAPLVPIEVDPAGVLTPPEDTDIVGWWRESANPGASMGQTVLTGHTVSTGGGVMNELGDLERGARVEVLDDEGRTIAYDVLEVFDYTREEVATNARALFGQDRPGGRLVLVTCTDWDGEVYQSNIIVFAEPVTGADAA